MTRIDRRALFATGSAAALLAAVGVSGATAPRRGGHLRAALSGGDRGESWSTMPGGRFLQAARAAVFETLTEIAPDGTLQPGLATAWTSSAEGRVWQFELRRDAVFHDGRELQAADVATSLQAQGLPALVAGDAVTVELGTADASLPLRMAQGDMSIFDASELGMGGPLRNGTGLYRVDRFDAGRGFSARRVDQHRKDGTAGWFDSVEFIAVSDEAVRAEAVRDGIVDVADLSTAFDLEANADVRVIRDGADVVAAVRQSLHSNARVGVAPLDDMRFSERWWSAA